MMWGYYSGMGGWMIFWMVLSNLVWLALIGVAVWALVRWVSHRTSTPDNPPVRGPTTEPSAEEILRQRYARGEIDEQTFARMRTQLDMPSTSKPSEQTLIGSGRGR